MQRDLALRALFETAKAQGWDAARLTEALFNGLGDKLEATPDEVLDTARYLADEYLQIGDGMLVVSTETGRVISKITEQDIWLPPPVPRESGGMAQPLARLQPGLEGMLVEWVFATSKERQTLARLADRSHQTILLRTDGDRRLLPASRRGRQTIVAELRDNLGALLFSDYRPRSGVPGLFLNQFFLREATPLDETLPGSPWQTGFARIVTPLVDMTTLNLRHDRLASFAAQIGTQWVRCVAAALAREAHLKFPSDPMPASSVTPEHLGGSNLWIADPDTAMYLAKMPGDKVPMLAVEAASFTGIRVGHTLYIHPGAYQIVSRELHGRWEIVATFEFKVALAPHAVQTMPLEGVPITGWSVR